MRLINTRSKSSLIFATALAGLASFTQAAAVPACLPDPDGQGGDTTKPVKVYILAGQSNMVGMGDLRGARNLYSGIFYTANPAIPKGPFTIFTVGNYMVKPLEVFGLDGSAIEKGVAKGSFLLPRSGVFRFDCGKGVMTVNGQEVYRMSADGEVTKKDLTLAAGRKHSFEITGAGDAPHFWVSKVDLQGHGDLESVVKRDGMFPWLVDDKGEWTVREDVYFQEARVAKEGKGAPLSATSNGNSIGPELGFGHVMGEFHDEQVLLIKTAMGNRSLGFDFRPPSSGRNAPDNKFESLEYTLMVEGVRKTLAKIDKVVPGYAGQGYEIAGFAWFQGHKDGGSEETISEYEQNLVNLINDVRKEFKVTKLPAVVATVGFGGDKMAEKYVRILEAQMAVGDPKQHPEFAGTVASVDIRPFWREVDESPRSQDYHYHRNAETYMRIGDALGRAMVALKGGTVEELPQPPRPKRVPEPTGEPTAEELAAAMEARAPIILNGIIPSYVADERNAKRLAQEATGTRPQRVSQFLRGAMFGLVNAYKAAGVDAYEWKVFGKDLRDLKWSYFSFDPKESLAREKGARYRKVSYPAGMEDWAAPDFDAAKAGWNKGLPPFGQLGGKLEPLRTCDRTGGCGCGEKPRTLWEKEVLLIRGTFDLPPIKDGHRYRIVVGGSNHVMTGEGYAIYLDGKLLAESTSGVPNRQGGQPRGGHVYAEHLDDLRDGKVTIAVTSFLQSHKRGNPIPPSGHLTVWIEEQKIPPVLDGLAASGE